MAADGFIILPAGELKNQIQDAFYTARLTSAVLPQAIYAARREADQSKLLDDAMDTAIGLDAGVPNLGGSGNSPTMTGDSAVRGAAQANPLLLKLARALIYRLEAELTQNSLADLAATADVELPPGFDMPVQELLGIFGGPAARK